MDDHILKHLQDVLNAIEELESYFVDYPKRYDMFVNDRLRRSGVERKVEIMGEALNRILKYDPNIRIPNAKEVVRTRNRVIHGYDSVEPEFLWGLVIRHIPVLKEDILQILSSEG